MLVGLSFLVLCAQGCSSDSEGESTGAAPGSAGSGASLGADGTGGEGADGTGGTGDTPTSSGGRSSGSGTGGGSSQAPGCGDDFNGATGEWVAQSPLTVAGAERSWWAWFPESYDPDRAYPVVFLFHGCGDETNMLPLENHTGDDAILVRGLADGPEGCWLTASETNGEFFEAMLGAISDIACVDSGDIFAVGYDSGAELVSRLGCYQAYLIDAVATVAGANALFSGPTCNGPVAAMMIHDETDMVQDISGSEEVRDRLIEQNFCVADGIPEAVDPAPCIQYSGCGDPVIWCATTGEGHDRQDAFAAPAIWDFLSSR